MLLTAVRVPWVVERSVWGKKTEGAVGVMVTPRGRGLRCRAYQALLSPPPTGESSVNLQVSVGPVSSLVLSSSREQDWLPQGLETGPGPCSHLWQTCAADREVFTLEQLTSI